MSPEEYFENYANATSKVSLESCSLRPIPEANHDPKNTRCKLISVPHNRIDLKIPILVQNVAKYQPDLIFIQMEPMPYLTRQRFLSHKCSLHEIEGYDVRDIENLNEPHPTSWEEAVVSPLILDMSNANQVHTKLDYTKGFFTYNYPTIQEKVVTDNLHNKFIGAITDYIVCDKWSDYHEINQILYTGVVGRQKVLLGDMPEILLRMILGNTITIDEARDMFKSVLSNIEKMKFKMPISHATKMFFSHVFLAPRDLYMTALLKNVLKACFSVLAFVGNPHFLPIQNYWLPPPNGVNYTQATKIPKRILNETDEMLIEKQAIFDVMLESRVWADKYLLNPFPYIETDVTKISKENMDTYKKTFFVNLKKYEAFKNRVYENLKQDTIGERKVKSLSDIDLNQKIDSQQEKHKRIEDKK